MTAVPVSLLLSSGLSVPWEATVLKSVQSVTYKVIRWKEELLMSRFKSRARNDYPSWGRHVESQDRPGDLLTQTVGHVVKAKEKLWGELKLPQWTRGWYESKAAVCWLGGGFSGLNRRSNQLQDSLKPRPHPEQGPNSLHLCEGWERWGSCRRKDWHMQRVVHEMEGNKLSL